MENIQSSELIQNKKSKIECIFSFNGIYFGIDCEAISIRTKINCLPILGDVIIVSISLKFVHDQAEYFLEDENLSNMFNYNCSQHPIFLRNFLPL
jgi:hypothetical protein